MAASLRVSVWECFQSCGAWLSGSPATDSTWHHWDPGRTTEHISVYCSVEHSGLAAAQALVKSDKLLALLKDDESINQFGETSLYCLAINICEIHEMVALRHNLIRSAVQYPHGLDKHKHQFQEFRLHSWWFFWSKTWFTSNFTYFTGL